MCPFSCNVCPFSFVLNDCINMSDVSSLPFLSLLTLCQSFWSTS